MSESVAVWNHCTGKSDCVADPHVHGCYADTGNCDDPNDHGDRLAEVLRLAAENERLRDLLRRSLKSHDTITAAYRTGSTYPTKRMEKALDDMRAVKTFATSLDLYPGPTSMLRTAASGRSNDV